MVIDPKSLENWVAELLRAHGAGSEKASCVAAALVEADRSGHSSHGVRQLSYYIDQIKRDDLSADADPVVVEQRGGLVVLDGSRGFGQVVGEAATDLALDLAATHAVGAVAGRNASHLGRLGAYTERIAERGMVGILLVNFQGGDPLVAPFGGFERRLGNNPISIGVPGPAVLDIALSVAAEGRVLQAHDRGEPLPDGWILDRDGDPSSDPADYLAGGALLAVGGHKGYGLIVLVELLVGLLSLGGVSGPGERSFSNAFVLLCIDPGDAARSSYLQELPAFVEWVKSSRRLPGTAEILLPGELEARRRTDSTVVRLDAPTHSALRQLARRAGVAPPPVGRDAV